MIFVQKRGPFESNTTVFEPSGPIKLRYLQIGIEYPHSIPISEYEVDANNKVTYPGIFNINDSSEYYVLTEKDVLEFSNLTLEKITVYFSSKKIYSNPYLTINVSYEEQNAD